jgi:multiple sugar transport system permease protein
VKRRAENATAYLFLAPWFVGLLVLTVGPMLASLYLSFTDFDLLTPPRWAGAANYREFAADPHFADAVRVTFTYVLVSVPLTVGVALAVAAALHGRYRGVGGYRAAYYLPSMLGGSVAVSVLWRQIFGDDGLVNRVLGLFGVVGPSWISTPGYALWTLIIMHVWQFGSPMLIFLAGLRQIPAELGEAAAVDGGGPVRRFVSVTLPLLTPLVFFNLVLQTINSFRAFTPAFIISGGHGGPADATLFYTLYLYQEGFTHFRMGYASAMAWTLLVVVALFTAGMFATARYWVYYADRDGSP